MATTIFGVLALASGVYLFLASTGFFAERAFLAAYRWWLLRSSSHAAALQAALRELARRPPFSALSQAELDRAGEALAVVLNPRALARIVRLLDRAGDARPLASEDFLRGIVFTYGRMMG